ncbi:abortive infection family protein [Palleronia sp. LCG004]|nr:abortive infection family protein [Palleronia sp. LCG004]WOI57490.1 abortive infection family protein [Palleronia sp. LCG004]
MSRDLDRATRNAEDDPEDAVTAACSTLEAVCRSIIVELGLELPAKKDVSALVRAVQEPLGLSPGRTDLPDLIASDIRKVLSGLTTATEGIGALRTHGGDAHGRERGHRRIDPRIARLAIHASSTIALFLIETWERKMQRALPEATEPTK